MAVLQIERLFKNYGDTKAVQDVSFSVQRGDVAGDVEAWHRIGQGCRHWDRRSAAIAGPTATGFREIVDTT